MFNALIIEPQDNVAVAIEPISKGTNTEQSGLKGGKYFCLQHFYMFKGGFLWI